jgi:hypothetical protein
MSTLDSKPLAAYRLGHHSVTFRLWLRLFWNHPDWETTDTGMSLTIDELAAALVTLAEDIPVNLYSELRDALSSLARLAAGVERAWGTTGKYQSLPFGSPVLPGESVRLRFRSLAERALVAHPNLNAWAILGARIGETLVALHENAGDDGLEHPRAIVDLVNALPADAVQKIPVLGVLTRRESTWSRRDVPAMLKQILKVCGTAPRIGLAEAGHEPHHLLAAFLALDGAIQEALRTLPHDSVVEAVASAPGADVSRPGYLGIILDARRQVGRVGLPTIVSFASQQRLWQLLEFLCRRGDRYSSINDVIAGGWVVHKASPELSTVYSAISRLRKLLVPLGVTVEYRDALGYRLVDQAPR